MNALQGKERLKKYKHCSPQKHCQHTFLQEEGHSQRSEPTTITSQQWNWEAGTDKEMNLV